MQETIRQILNKKDNDYTALERKFFEITGENLLQETNFAYKDNFKHGITVVIPSRDTETLENTLASVVNNVKNIPYELIEVIVLDDASSSPLNAIVDKFAKDIDITLVRHYVNRTGGQIRKSGAMLAKHEIILFIDADIVLTSSLIRNHLVVHNVLFDKLLLTGFSETADSNDMRFYNQSVLDSKGIDFKNTNFRWSATVKEEWRTQKDLIGKTFNVATESNLYKDFGFGKKIGLWTLPMMGENICMSTSKKSLISTGMTPERLYGWGWNGACVTAKLIAYGHYIVPSLNGAVLQFKHPIRAGGLSDKRDSFDRNQKVYEDMLDQEFKPMDVTNYDNPMYYKAS
jgi:glycosyltransferase involved in cell wall biosynthesis